LGNIGNNFLGGLIRHFGKTYSRLVEASNPLSINWWLIKASPYSGIFHGRYRKALKLGDIVLNGSYQIYLLSQESGFYSKSTLSRGLFTILLGSLVVILRELGNSSSLPLFKGF